MYCDEDTADLFNANCPPSITLNYSHDDHYLQIIEQKKSHLIYSHFIAFITSYVRIQLIDQLLKLDISKIYRIVSDGIYTTQENFEIISPFRIKEGVKLNNTAGEWYVSHENNYFEISQDNTINKKYQAHYGSGGSGKTYKVLNNRGLVNVCYLAPSWKLSKAKEHETNNPNIIFKVWKTALSKVPEKWQDIKKRSNVLVIDEISMMSESEMKNIIERFPYHKIIFCGDIGYQLPPINEENNCQKFITKNNMQEFFHNEDYRSQDQQTKDLKIMLRKFIDDGIHSNEIIKKITPILKNIEISDLKNIYTTKDIILTKTNEKKDRYTEIFKDHQKIMITKNIKNTPYSNGEIVSDLILINYIKNEKIFSKGYENRHAFTVHSVQGETIEEKLFIDLENMNPSMIYTAISRIRKMENIYVIIPDNKTCSICLCENTDYITKCLHHFHENCLAQWVRNKHGNRTCPYCRNNF